MDNQNQSAKNSGANKNGEQTGQRQEAPMSDMQKSIMVQLEEIDKYKWYLGEALKRDPLQDRSYDDICMEWIQKHAADFRKWWEERQNTK
jgi:hypothetical protein